MLILPLPATDDGAGQDLEGIGRGNFLVSIVGLVIFAVAASENTGYGSWGYAFGAVQALFPTYLRLKNLVWSSWLLLLILIPGVNLLFALSLIIFPEDYARTHKLDRAAKTILWWGGGLGLLLTLLFGSNYYREWRNSQPVTRSEIERR